MSKINGLKVKSINDLISTTKIFLILYNFIKDFHNILIHFFFFFLHEEKGVSNPHQ